METTNKSGGQSAAGVGPYKATQLWNDVISAFRQGVPVGKHRRYMRTAENCFVGSSAVDWLLDYLKKRKDFGSDVSRKQTTQLLNKFYKAGIFEEIQVSRRGRNKNDFSDSNRLYRLMPLSPSKGTRTPLATRSVNSIPYPGNKSSTDDKREKRKVKDTKAVDGSEKKKGTKTAGTLAVENLPQCHLVGRFLSAPEINEIWKTAALSRLKKVLGVASLDDTLQGYAVDGSYVRHNCIFLNKSGIVTNIQPEDQLPHWVLSAMKCLARWPEKVEGDLPSYPGFEKDVFGVVRDYFNGLREPLLTYELYDIVITVFVQACNQLPRHSSPFSHAARDGTRLGQSLFSSSSLENVILNLTRKYCMTDSKTDLYSLTDSRPDLFHTTGGYSQSYSRSGLPSMLNSQGNLADSQRNLACDQRHLADSHRDLASGRDRNDDGSRKDLLRMARSQGDLCGTSKSQTNTLPATHSKSQSHLLDFPARSLVGSISKSHTDLNSMGESLGNVHDGRSVTNLHAAAPRSLRRSGLSSTLGSQSALGGLSGPCSLQDSKQFSSSPNLPVTRYETSFGPENKTVTRVYYRNGVATDFHHSSARAEEGDISHVETHFDIPAENSFVKNQSGHVSLEQTNKSADAAGCFEFELSRGTAGQSRSFNQFQKEQQQAMDVPGFSPHHPTSNPWETGPELAAENIPESPEWARERKPPPYRRTRAERYKTFAGSQFSFGQEVQAESRALDDWDKQMSSSTPYLPGLRMSGGGDSTGPRPRQFVSKSTGAAAKRTIRKCSSMYMSYPQSSLDEERATKALQVVCLCLPPASRRKLHFLLKLMAKMAANPFLTFDPSQSTRSLVLGTFQNAILRSHEETELDAVLVFQLVSFLVDHHMDVMEPPTDMKDAVENRLRSLEKPQIVYSPRDPGTVRFSQPISVQQYETMTVDHSHQALVDLLDSIVRDQNMADRDKRRRLKQFQKTYPQIYQQRFPHANSDPLHTEQRLRTKPPIFPRPLSKLRSLRV